MSLQPGNNAPVLNAYVNIATEQVEVWCATCEKWHHHGYEFGDEEKPPQHVCDHCWVKGSPFKRTGYWLHIVGYMDEQKRREIERFERARHVRTCAVCNEKVARTRCLVCSVWLHRKCAPGHPCAQPLYPPGASPGRR